MEFLGVLGLGIMVVGNVWMLVRGFTESIAWGLGMLLLPFVGLFFLVMHWDKAKHPFLVNIVGIVIMFIGFGLGADSTQAAP